MEGSENGVEVWPDIGVCFTYGGSSHCRDSALQACNKTFAGRYSLSVLFGKDQRYVLFRMDDIIFFEIENTSTERGSNMSVTPGVIRPMLSSRHSFVEKCSVAKD